MSSRSAPPTSHGGRFRTLNRRTDQLHGYLATNGAETPRARGLKPLKGDPPPLLNHEVDVGHDVAAAWGFAHLEPGPGGHLLVLDRVGDALH